MGSICSFSSSVSFELFISFSTGASDLTTDFLVAVVVVFVICRFEFVPIGAF